MRTLIVTLIACLRAALMSRASLALENAALRQQLAVYLRTNQRARLRTEDRLFWVVLRRLWSDWTRALAIVKPATVISWHRRGFRMFWRRRSRSRAHGRPRIPREHIAFIQRISGDHPEWGEDRIAEELAAKFGVDHSCPSQELERTGILKLAAAFLRLPRSSFRQPTHPESNLCRPADSETCHGRSGPCPT
jgi:hypothetical protein